MLLAASTGFHLVVVMRIAAVEGKSFLSVAEGGTLDYGRYLRACPKRGWSRSVAYLVPIFLLGGIGLIVVALVRQ
jgi:hypothetical protein